MGRRQSERSPSPELKVPHISGRVGCKKREIKQSTEMGGCLRPRPTDAESMLWSRAGSAGSEDLEP